MADIFNNILQNTNQGFAEVRKFEDLMSFKREIGENTHADEDKVRPLKARLMKTGAALEARGLPVDYHGVKAE